MLEINKNGYAQLVLRGNYIRRQDIPPIYDIANNCWIFSRKAILRSSRIPPKTIPYEINGFHVDIDKEDDLKIFHWFLKSGEEI